jgi:hypothetical protein
MPGWLQAVFGIVGGLILVWLILVLVLWVEQTGQEPSCVVSLS